VVSAPINIEAADPVWATDGRVAGALQFNGSNSCVRVPDAPYLRFTDGVTLMAWVRRDGPLNPAEVGMIVSKHFTNGSRAWDLHVSVEPNGYAFGFNVIATNNVPNSLKAPGNVTAAQWFHVAGTYDRTSGTQVLYVDGVQVASSTPGSFQIMSTTVPVRIGCYNDSADGSISRAYFFGLIDEVMVFNRALSAASIAAYYNGTP
jgi:hypothetical protein